MQEFPSNFSRSTTSLSEMKQNPDLVLANLDPSDLFDELSKY